jgi:hypothetical protein
MWRFDKVDFTRHRKKFVQDWYDRERKANTLYDKDRCANMAVFISPVIADGATKDFYARERSNRVVSFETLVGCVTGKANLYGKGVDDNNGMSFIDYDRNMAKDCYFMPDYYMDAPDKIFNLELYRKLKEISEESAILRMIVAWYIYNNGYMDALSEKQAEFWETDFCLLDMLEGDDNYQVNWLISYTNIDAQTFYKHRAYIQEHLSEFYDDILCSNA